MAVVPTAQVAASDDEDAGAVGGDEGAGAGARLHGSPQERQLQLQRQAAALALGLTVLNPLRF